FMRLFRSDDKFSQMLTQLQLQPEYGGDSGSGGCGDDELGDDEDGGEDEEEVDDTMSPGIVAREGIPFELFRSRFPGRHVAWETYPRRQVAQDSPELSLGKMANCKGCNKTHTITMISGQGFPLTHNLNMRRASLVMQLLCDGYKPLGFTARGLWKGERANDGTEFKDLDVSKGSYYYLREVWEREFEISTWSSSYVKLDLVFIFYFFPLSMVTKVHSNADLTRTISKSIFVTNFSDNTTSADLWKICQTYGVVVDVYIPNRRSKVGKRFAFVRFIKVTNVERLIGNLCTLWISRMHLHANVVRFERTPFHQSQPPPPTRPGKIAPSFVSAVKGILPTPVLSPPAMVLDDSCMVTTDLRNYVMGEVKLFSSVNNLRVILSAEGFSIQKVVCLGGLWVLFELPSANSKSKFLAHVGVGSWFKSLSNPQPDFSPRDRIIWVDVEGVPMHAWSSNTFHKIGSMWGKVLELGDCKDECFARKSKRFRNTHILEKFKIIVKGKSFVVRAKELFVWSPSFVEVTEADDTHEEGEFIQNGQEGLEKPIHQTNVEEESDIEAISKTFFGDQENKDVNAAATNSSIPFSPGFTPDKPDTDVGEQVAQKDQFQPDVKSVGSSSHTVESANNVDDQFSTESIENIQKKKESGSILEILDLSIQETKAENVLDMKIKSLWGNTNFDAIVSQSLSNSEGLLCVWDPNSFQKDMITLSFPSHIDHRKYKEEDEMKIKGKELRERNKLKT
nr:RNA-directed DNA polymerase, eukaryota, nucleotide-binding alpha-beta plait domain protein [Tanacetum cinerariifolium]